MAKIPRLRTQNQLAPTGGGAPVNPAQASARSRELAKAGQSVAQFSSQLDRYFKEKKRVDLALHGAEWSNKTILKGQEAEAFVKTNPESARDGSSVFSDFNRVFGPIKEEALAIEDRDKRAVALQAVNRAEATYRNKITSYGIAKHNSYVAEAGDERLREMTFRIQNDPSQLVSTLQEWDALSESMPYMGKNKERFRTTGRRSLADAALESYAAQGKYDDARALLNNTQLGKLYSQKEREKKTDQLFDEEYEKSRRKYMIEEQEIKKMKREKEDMQEKNSLNLLSKMIDAGSPVLRDQVIEEVEQAAKNGLISPTQRKAFFTVQDNIEEDISHDLRRDYIVDFYRGKPYSEIKQQVTSDMAAGNMTHIDGEQILSKLKEEHAKELKDPAYKAAKKRAKDYIRARVPGREGIAGFFYGQEAKLLINKIDTEAARLEARGMGPEKAAQAATAKILGPERLTTGRIALQNFGNNIEALKEYREQLANTLKDRGPELDSDAKMELRRTFEEVKIRINALETEEEYNKLLRFMPPAVKEGE